MTRPRERTLVTLLERAAREAGDRGFTFHTSEGPLRHAYAEVLELARSRASSLAERGIERGDRVGIAGPNDVEWMLWAFGAWLRGAVVVPIQFGGRIGDLQEYVASLRYLVATAGCKLVVADPRFVPAFETGSVDWTTAHDGSVVDAIYPDPGDVAVLQFTSGSTASPKVAALSHDAILACVDGFLAAFGVRLSDVSLSWLPFFHDNGLFGHLVGPVAALIDGHVIPTERFARNPAVWFRTVGEIGATSSRRVPARRGLSRSARRSGTRRASTYPHSQWGSSAPRRSIRP